MPRLRYSDASKDDLKQIARFIAQDKPDPNNAEDVKRWLIRKRALQKMILEELDLDQYVDILVGPEITENEEESEEPPPEEEPVAPVSPSKDTLPPETSESPPVTDRNKIRQLIGKIPGLGKMLAGQT